MKVTVTFHPKPKNRRILGELFDDMKKSGVDIEYKSLDSVIVEAKHQPTTEKLLLMHGYQITKEDYIQGAVDLLADKYQLNEMFSEDEIPRPEKSRTVDKKSLVGNLHRKVRETRKARGRSRTQHVRDNLEGQVSAFEAVLRWLRKR